MLATDDPHLTATTCGSFDIGKDNITFLDATVTLDATALGQGQGGVHGVVQGKLTATSTAEDGTAKTELRIVIDRNSVVGQPGEPLAVVGQLVTLDCEGRSRCTADLGFGASMGSTDAVDVHVELDTDGRLPGGSASPHPAGGRTPARDGSAPQALSSEPAGFAPPTTSAG